MYVSVIHTIHEPEKFWRPELVESIPEGVTLNQALPNGDGSRATCLWQADSLETVRNVVEDTVGDVSDNEYFEVNEQNAQGLPAQATT
jgi:hypothetical protein